MDKIDHQHEQDLLAEVPERPEQIAVQVCYATPTLEFLRDLVVPLGTTVQQAIELSALIAEIKGIDLAFCLVGIYGKKKTLGTVLRQHDRVEVYRPLLADPKEARRRRAGVKEASPPR